jgi:cyclohexadienyl dehydratase
LDSIRARGELRVGTTGDYRPFSFRSADGAYSGADIAMAMELAEKLDVKLVFVPTVWANLLDDFLAGKFDVAMGGVTVTAARAEKGAFSIATLVDGKRPIARCADKNRFVSIESMNRPDVRVITNPGSANELFARTELKSARVIIHSDNASVFGEIIAGRADVMVTDGIEADHQAAIHPELCATAVAEPFTRLEKAYFFAKDEDLKRLVDQWLVDAQRSGHWRDILAAALRER